MIHQFTAKLSVKEGGGETTSLAERLYAIADDALFVSRSGDIFVSFDRDAATLEQAVRSAISDVARAGATVTKIAIEHEEFPAWLEES